MEAGTNLSSSPPNLAQEIAAILASNDIPTNQAMEDLVRMVMKREHKLALIDQVIRREITPPD